MDLPYVLLASAPTFIFIAWYILDNKNKCASNLRETERETESETEEWELYEEKTFTQKSTMAQKDVNLKKLGELICRSIKIYGMQMNGIAELAKDLTIDIGYTLIENNDSRRIIRQEEFKNGKKCFLVFKMIKEQKKISGNLRNLCICRAQRYIFHVEYTILIPINNSAEQRCNEFFRDKIDTKLENHIQLMVRNNS
tara:strand:- start:16 stop:606 length:591 start_codon:yes stop_codon:yes gene_type:complete